MRILGSALGAVTAITLFAAPGLARQQPTPIDGVIDVFLDCNAPFCDFDHFRREITWVNWVRDRTDADIHLLVTAQSTGAQGWQFTLDYLRQDGIAGPDKSLGYTSDPDDTGADVRDGLTRTMALGLVSFVETTAVAPRLRVTLDEDDDAPIQDETDPWNLWVFRLSADASIEGESQERGYELDGSVRADRVAEDLKINFEAEVEYDREEFDELEEGETFVNTVTDYSTDLLIVWSLDDQWSAGGTIEARKSTFLNQDLTVSAGPAVEYNIFPYAESTRRSFTFRYTLEVVAFDYDLVTVEGKLNEVLPRHSLTAAAAVQQPWGQVFGSVTGLQYLHDPATHRIDTFLFVEYRLFRGFSVDVFGSFGRIKDQFFLPAETLSPEEILVRRRQRETEFRFDLGVGFNYRFGSRIANIVNPRM